MTLITLLEARTMSNPSFVFDVGQAVRHKISGEEGNVVSRDGHWYRGNAYRLRFAGSRYMNLTWFPEDELVALRPGSTTPPSLVEDMAEFNASLPDPYEDAPGG